MLALLREAVSEISGYKLNIKVQEGPGQFSAPVEIQLMSEDLSLIEKKTRELKYIDQNIEGLTTGK